MGLIPSNNARTQTLEADSTLEIKGTLSIAEGATTNVAGDVTHVGDVTHEGSVTHEGDVEIGAESTLELGAGATLDFGGVAFVAGTDRITKVIEAPLVGVVATTGGAIAAVANPEGATVIITRVLIHRTTKSTGAAAGDIGVAADATTSSDTLIDGVALGATEGLEDNVTNGGTNGKARQLWGASQFVTVTGAADSSGLVGSIFIEYFLA